MPKSSCRHRKRLGSRGKLWGKSKVAFNKLVIESIHDFQFHSFHFLYLLSSKGCSLWSLSCKFLHIFIPSIHLSTYPHVPLRDLISRRCSEFLFLLFHIRGRLTGEVLIFLSSQSLQTPEKVPTQLKLRENPQHPLAPMSLLCHLHFRENFLPSTTTTLEGVHRDNTSSILA